MECKSKSSHNYNYTEHAHHAGSLRDELIHHFPFAAFSVASGFIALSVFYFLGEVAGASTKALNEAYHTLFHAFHYLHLVFATTGTFVMFSRFSKRLIPGLLVATISPAIFCTLSDIALPALAGNILGVSMGVHICFAHLHDTLNLIPFVVVGLLNGVFLRWHSEAALSFFSVRAHFVHILISSLAAMFYMVSFGFDRWYDSMGLLFIFLILAVVVPCTVSDVVVPMYFARFKAKKDEKHSH